MLKTFLSQKGDRVPFFIFFWIIKEPSMVKFLRLFMGLKPRGVDCPTTMIEHHHTHSKEQPELSFSLLFSFYYVCLQKSIKDIKKIFSQVWFYYKKFERKTNIIKINYKFIYF